MPVPKDRIIDWEAIKLSAVAGVPYATIARHWGIMYDNGKPDTTAIRQRAFQEKWPVLSRIRNSTKRQITKLTDGQKVSTFDQNGQKVSIPVSSNNSAAGERATVMLSENLHELAKAGTLRYAQVAQQSLTLMPDSLPITSPSDASTTVKTLRAVAGLDRPESPVNVIVGGNWGEWSEPARDVSEAAPSLDPLDY